MIAFVLSECYDADATFRVVKNRLTLRAAEKAGTQQIQELLDGPTALTFVRGDAALAAKALNDFARAGAALEFKGAVLEGQTLTVDEIRAIARLPVREVLHAQLVGTIAAPITGLVRGLNALIAGVALQLRQIEEQGLVGGEAEPAEPAAEEAPAEEAPAEEAPAEEPSPADETDNEEADASAAADEGAAEA